MRGWLGGMMAFLLSLGAVAGAAAVPVDCGPAPDTKCLAGEIFTLAKTLPEDDGFRRHVAFAEQELAPGDLKTALEYVVWDNPDPSPWEDVEWIARAGRFDAAIKAAQLRTAPVERLGGLLAVAEQKLNRNDKAAAQKIVEDVERQLSSIAGDSDDYADSIPRTAGELWARLGQTDRAARLIRGASAVTTLLAIAAKYPSAVSLREQAWREAERANEPYDWQFLVEDAMSRGDQAEISRAAKRASDRIGSGQPDAAVSLARVVLSAGLPDVAARLIEPWPQWVKGKEGINHVNVVNTLIPVLAGLARDQDVETVIRAVSSSFHRSDCLSRAAEQYFRLGRHDIAAKFDAEAFAVAIASPTREPKQQSEHDAALNNLALARAGRGDIDGAIIAVAKLRDEAKARDVLSYVVRRAIDSGHEPVVGPVIEALERRAGDADAALLLQVANSWIAVGGEGKARASLSAVMKLVDARQVQLTASDSALAAELTWRLDGAGKAEAMLAIVDKIGMFGPVAIDPLIEVIRPVSPAVAVRLTERQDDVTQRILELANIAIQIAAKPQ